MKNNKQESNKQQIKCQYPFDWGALLEQFKVKCFMGSTLPLKFQHFYAVMMKQSVWLYWCDAPHRTFILFFENRSREERWKEGLRDLKCLLFVLKQINNKLKQRIRDFKNKSINKMWWWRWRWRWLWQQ